MKLSNINMKSTIVEYVDPKDFPDFSDACFSYAEYKSGTPLTEEELEEMTDLFQDELNEIAHESLI